MKHHGLKMYTAIIVSLLTMAACGSSKSALSSDDDDVYYSKKESSQQTTYVPEVDVQELIKKNPPQYNKQYEAPSSYRTDESSNNNINPNAALQYPSYRAARDAEQQQEAESQTSFLTTTSYAGQEDEAAEAARLRMQYGGVYNDYSTTNYYGTNWDNSWNNWNGGWNNAIWGGPGINIGWNNFTGWGVGIGWNTGWGWGYDPFWRWNNPWYGWGYDPFWGWGGGWNSWCGPGWNNGWGWNNWGWRNQCNNNWGHNGFVERAQAPQQRVRQMPGSSLPGTSPERRQAIGGQMQQAQGSGTEVQNRAPIPRSGNEAQLINRNGQQIYVAPEQYRTPAPRSYSTYQKSEQQAEAARQATPRPTYTAPQTPATGYQRPGNGQPSSTPAPSNQRGSNVSRSYQYSPQRQNTNSNNNNQEQQPSFRRQAPSRSFEQQQPSYSPGPSRSYSPPSTGGGSSGGGSRGGSSGGGGSSMPRPRSR